MMSMRTTLTIEPAVAQQIRKRMRAKGMPLKLVVNEALREGLRVLEAGQTKRRPRFKVDAHAFGFRPGIDLDRISRFADDVEDEETVARINR
jgi:hypothetical protein